MLIFRTYNNLPDGRKILIKWMGRWEYCVNMNFNAWNGQMSFPRELNLVKVGDQYRLASYPVRELDTLRMNPVCKTKINIANVFEHKLADVEKKAHLADIDMTIDLKKLKAGDSFDMVFSGKKDELKISFKDNVFYLDRTKSGKIIPNYRIRKYSKGTIDDPDAELAPMHKSFADIYEAPRVLNSTNLKLRITIDANIIEMFADDGLTSMSALFFSDDGIASKMTIQVNSKQKSQIQLKKLNVYEMKSIWQKDDGVKKKTSKIPSQFKKMFDRVNCAKGGK